MHYPRNRLGKNCFEEFVSQCMLFCYSSSLCSFAYTRQWHLEKSFTVVGDSSSKQQQQRVRPLPMLQMLAYSYSRSLLNSIVSHNSFTLCCVIPWSSETWRHFYFHLNKSFLSVRSSSYNITRYHRTVQTEIWKHCFSPSQTPPLRILSSFTPLSNNCSHVLMAEYNTFFFPSYCYFP